MKAEKVNPPVHIETERRHETGKRVSICPRDLTTFSGIVAFDGLFNQGSKPPKEVTKREKVDPPIRIIHVHV
ncbi:hypothetical protein KHA94_08950 [Bacillus sp. FJAT-49705]|uniref:Uncharacterized protein n=1 Tax=Cytobacillus citreus TaxID=2833586 RepID=A0ABS5NR81_9BACI|nr:hypothetical protein [Cytobacillus citreus]MBS4190329.1 hypothetical protein [Cytobacillus citreus]